MADDYLDRMLDGIEVAQTLQRVLDKRFGPGAAVLDNILRNSARSLVISGDFRGQPAIFKKSLTSDARDIAKRAASVTQQIALALTGNSRIAPCLANLPGQGLVIYGRAEGACLKELLATADDAMRDRLITALGNWLTDSATIEQQVAQFDGGWDLTDLTRHLGQLPPANCNDLPRQLWELLHRFSLERKGVPIRKITGHSDCHPGNFIWSDPELCAIDLEDLRLQPTSKILGRFLGRSPPRDITRLTYGACADDYDLLSRLSLLEPGEAGLTLPYYTACTVLRFASPLSTTPEIAQRQKQRLQSAITNLTTLLESRP